MQNRLGIAVWLFIAAENEIARRLERHRIIVIRRHRTIVRIAGVLFVDDFRHPLERLKHLLFRANAMMEPVGENLARDAKRRPVFHQSDVVNVRHFRAADPLVDPADDIA